jgi:hypothetical protein
VIGGEDVFPDEAGLVVIVMIGVMVSVSAHGSNGVVGNRKSGWKDSKKCGVVWTILALEI